MLYFLLKRYFQARFLNCLRETNVIIWTILYHPYPNYMAERNFLMVSKIQINFYGSLFFGKVALDYSFTATFCLGETFRNRLMDVLWTDDAATNLMKLFAELMPKTLRLDARSPKKSLPLFDQTVCLPRIEKLLQLSTPVLINNAVWWLLTNLFRTSYF